MIIWSFYISETNKLKNTNILAFTIFPAIFHIKNIKIGIKKNISGINNINNKNKKKLTKKISLEKQKNQKCRNFIMLNFDNLKTLKFLYFWFQ